MPEHINNDNESKFNSKSELVHNICKMISDKNMNRIKLHRMNKYSDVRKKPHHEKQFSITLNKNSICYKMHLS